MGELTYFLGVKIIQNKKTGSIWLGQKLYTESAGPADRNYYWSGARSVPKIFVFLIIFMRGVAYFNY